MKTKFYFIFILLGIFFSACEENTKTIITEDKPEKKESIEKVLTQILTTLKEPTKPIIENNQYEFKNLKGEVNKLDIKNDIYNFKNIKQSIVILNIMSTWCPPCRGQIPHLSKLQQKFKENVFVMSTLIHDDLSSEKLEKLIIAQKILFYVSITQEENLKFINSLTPKLGLPKDFPMPLTIVFVRGKYFTHYEGMIPEEMIESDIKQLLKKIKK